MIDITRLIRRAGRVLTGVDRVEMAYALKVLAGELPVFAIARTPFGYVLLDRSGLERIAQRLEACAFSKPDFLSRMQRGLSRAEQGARTDVRRVAVARCLPHRLARVLAAHLPRGASYVNVGHSNLTQRVLHTMKHSIDARIVVMIHDVIPLDYPQYQRAGTVETFRKKLACVQTHADVVLYNSADTRARTEAHMRLSGEIPNGIVAHLATEAPRPNADFTCPQRPYFVTIGTIEPRKNHAFLLDLWDQMGPYAPQLHICGGRGWNNDAVFARLDALPADGPVVERTGLSDGDMAALLQGSNGLLFPSLAEGFGLPLIEAATLGVPILCNPLDVIHEILGDIPVYAAVSDSYLWTNGIKELAHADPEAVGAPRYKPQTWDDHFKVTLRMF